MNEEPSVTEAELARVLELDAKATKGPWSHYQITQDRGHFRYLQSESNAVGVINTWPNLADADLIAEYRTLTPRLARELAAARAAIKVAREAVKEVQQLASRIREICQTEEFPKDAAWVPTISAHALVIGDYSTDTIDALAQLNTHAHE